MQATDNIAERTNRRCAQLLAIILVVLALIEFFPAIAKYFTAYSVPPVFSLSRSESPQTVAVADSSAISNTGETAPSEYFSDYSGQVAPADESDKRSLLPSSLPEQSGSEQPVEEKVKQDFKETIEQFRKAERQPLREPPAARPEPVSSEESEISSADKIVVTEAAPVPVPVDILIPAPERPVAAGTAIADKLGRSAPEAEQLNQFRDQLHTESDADSATDPEQTLPESARRFLAEIDSLQHPDFQPAEGYWANTYIPGDPLMRQLESRLQGEPSFHLVRQIRPNRQPFDPPQYSALALYVNADKASVSGPTRLKLQIGLQASLRQSGQRPAMNIGIVLDWRNPVADMAVVRALLMALQQAKQPGDRFSLIITGKSGSVQVSADQFRFGPLQLALSQLSEKTAPQDPPLSLSEAVSTAADQVRQLDDPNAGLGSSLVLLITTDSLNDDLATLESLAHRNAIEGIFLSVINIGQLARSSAKS
jgi:hypothetical protein